jgi:hypothetical protein
MKKKILLVGWNPDVVDYSKWPELTLEKLRAGLKREQESLISLGYEATWGLIDSVDTAPDTVTELLSKQTYDCVLIGAGVRASDDYVLLFETLINIVHKCAPSAKICFNTGPFDSADAVQRWV